MRTEPSRAPHRVAQLANICSGHTTKKERNSCNVLHFWDGVVIVPHCTITVQTPSRLRISVPHQLIKTTRLMCIPTCDVGALFEHTTIAINATNVYRRLSRVSPTTTRKHSPTQTIQTSNEPMSKYFNVIWISVLIFFTRPIHTWYIFGFDFDCECLLCEHSWAQCWFSFRLSPNNNKFKKFFVHHRHGATAKSLLPSTTYHLNNTRHTHNTHNGTMLAAGHIQ